jgi:hypothetical protein
MDAIFHKSEWMESGEAPGLAPTVFLVEQPPDTELQTHFHRQNQFQLFIDGTAVLGREKVLPVTIHYAGAYTGYGPLRSGPQGLKYFTIRSAFDTGLIPASEAKERMVRGPKRHAQAFLGEPMSIARLALLADVQRETAIAPAGGLGVQILRLPPGARAELPGIEQSAGQFVFVLSGAARIGAGTLERWESAFIPAADAAAAVHAGTGGAEIVALHIPAIAPEYAA